MEATVFYLWNKTKSIVFKKYLKRFYSQQHEKETGLNEYVHNFSVDNNIIDNSYY